eukprot:5008971-Amphidinium_carterae.1
MSDSQMCLPSELIAWEGKDHKPLVGPRFVQVYELSIVLLSEALGHPGMDWQTASNDDDDDNDDD